MIPDTQTILLVLTLIGNFGTTMESTELEGATLDDCDRIGALWADSIPAYRRASAIWTCTKIIAPIEDIRSGTSGIREGTGRRGSTKD